MKYSLLLASAILAGSALADPAPGDYFREYTFMQRFGEIDPQAKRPGTERMKAHAQAERKLTIPHIGKATRAEVSVSYWGGHIGTSEQKFKINGGEWIDVAQPKGTPTTPNCYYRTMVGRATTTIPLESLKTGANVFQFTAGPQLCNSFNWGFWWVYEFTVRLYYDKPAETPGEIVAPLNNSVIGENPVFTAKARREHTPITHVDFVGEYDDFNWEGDGVTRQWHYIVQRGRLARHIGSADAVPYTVRWDTEWVPDQDKPIRVAARIYDLDGFIYMTEPVTVTLQRTGRSVKMYSATNVPQGFGVRVGRRKECTLPVQDELAGVKRARLVLSTWSGGHGDEIGLNGTKLVDRVGLVHNYSFDSIEVPAKLLKPGANTFHMMSKTDGHALEVNWPGPALLVEYSRK